MPKLYYKNFDFIAPNPLTWLEYNRLKTMLTHNPEVSIIPGLEFYDHFESHIISVGFGFLGILLINLDYGLLSVFGLFITIPSFFGIISLLLSLFSYIPFANSKVKYYSKLKKDILDSTDYQDFKNKNKVILLNSNYNLVRYLLDPMKTRIHNQTTTVHNLLVLAILLLLAAPFDFEYGYYIFLRITISFISGTYLFVNLKSIQNGFTLWNIVFLLLFILFNPIIPIYFEKDTWEVLDVISAVVIAVRYYQILRK